ncbi:hypothetical protein QY903_09180 [Lactiplantibacillus paraplantarum]
MITKHRGEWDVMGALMAANTSRKAARMADERPLHLIQVVVVYLDNNYNSLLMIINFIFA